MEMKHSCIPTFFASMDGFMKGGKMFKMTPGVVASLGLEWMATS